MDSQSAVEKKGVIKKITSSSQNIWSGLSEKQKSILIKIWSIITYKWQWQIILNAPFLIIWALDQTIPAVHTFDTKLISSLPIPTIVKTYLGFT
tara:strand:- start:160 stop:441 length:282 start_codon:yes stop_codon:yes gene_type:complete